MLKKSEQKQVRLILYLVDPRYLSAATCDFFKLHLFIFQTKSPEIHHIILYLKYVSLT